MKKSFAVLAALLAICITAAAENQEITAAELAKQTQVQAENLLVRWADALLAQQIKEGEEFGNFICEACPGLVHGRIIDTVWPYTWLWQRTGQQRYLDAARDAVHWGAIHLQQADGSYKNDYENNWRGITEFSQISLGKTLLRFGNVIPKEIADEWRDLFVRQSDYIYRWLEKPLDNTNVNYQAARPLCMELAFRLTGEQRFREFAEQQAIKIVAHFGEDGILFGESHPSSYISPKGFRGVDLGYNVEESLPLLFEYAEMVEDKALLKILVASARTHLEFILPDGGLDNSTGTRSNKWSYWGSRTSDGILCMLSGLAKNGCPEALRVAKYTLDLYERCTNSKGLLAGGLYYDEAGEAACVHHTFCHIKPLPDWISADFSALGDAVCPPLFSETAFGVKYFPSRNIHLIGTRSWRATLNNADNWFNRESQTTAGGSLSLLYHRKVGPILAGTALTYKTDEPQNMQWQKHDKVTRSFTPRIENGEFSNVYDKDAVVTVKSGKRCVRILVEGNLTDEKGTKSSPFRIEYRLRGDKLTIRATGEGKFIIPVISTPKDLLATSGDKKLVITRDAGIITLRTSSKLSLEKTDRPDGFAFTPIGGFMSPYPTIPLNGKRTKITLSVKGR